MNLVYYLQLLVVLLLVFGVLLFLWKIAGFIQKKKYSGEIKEVDRLAIDNGVTLFIIEVQGCKYFLSVGGKEVRLLKKLL